jgi:hypothetical protein
MDRFRDFSRRSLCSPCGSCTLCRIKHLPDAFVEPWGPNLLESPKKNRPRWAGCFCGVPKGIRTPVAAVKGQCPRPTRRWGRVEPSVLNQHQTVLQIIRYKFAQITTLLLSPLGFEVMALLRKVLNSRRIGGARRDRTADLYNAIVALSQLSYGPSTPETRGARNLRILEGGVKLHYAIFSSTPYALLCQSGHRK